MIGSGAAVAEMGAHHHELHGHAAFAAWLGVHAWLMSGVHERVDAFVSWGWDFLGSSRSGALVDDPGTARIDWGDDDADAEAGDAHGVPSSDDTPAAVPV
jgi:NADH:quinone reductase (non-electrogenic)